MWLPRGARYKCASQVALVVKNPPANAADRDPGSIPGSGRSLGGGHSSPLQYSYLENPVDRGAWWVTVYRVSESDMTEATEHARMHRYVPYWFCFSRGR